MYANTHNPSGGYQPSKAGPGSLAIAVGVNAALIGALLYAGPVFEPAPPREPTTIFDVPIKPPPPERMPPKEKVADPRPAQPDRIEKTELPIITPLDERVTYPDTPPVPPSSGATEATGTGSGTGIAIDPPRPPLPLLVQPGVDPRYAAEFQPVYPSDERRAGRDGRVVVRALVGVDGRVKQLERLTATSDSFWRTTLDRALRRWRFTPGTRDGIPVEAWRTMTLTFRMED